MNFDEEINKIFEPIWNCEIEHPEYQEKVGDLMDEVKNVYAECNINESTGKWIPLTERPPKESGEYFVTLKRVLLPISVFHPENNTYEYVTRIDRFNGEKFDMPTVVAWWSERLPKPWEGNTE